MTCLTNEQHEMLLRCASQNGVNILDLSLEEKEVLAYLIEKRYCKRGDTLIDVIVKIDERGKQYIHLTKELEKQAAKYEADKRADRRAQYVREIVVAVISILGTLIVERLPNILRFFASFFGR